MQASTYVFEPENSSNYILAISCSIIAIASIIGLVIYNRKQQKTSERKVSSDARRFQPLISLGLFFLFLICLTTAFFSWLTTQKITKVTITDTFIETPYGKTDWDNIQRIYIHEDQKVAPFSGRSVGEKTKILMIIEIEGKTHALSELNYDLNEIGKAIKAVKKE